MQTTCFSTAAQVGNLENFYRGLQERWQLLPVSPFIGSREQVGETKSACFSSFTLVLGGLAKRGPLTLSFSPSRVVFTHPADELCNRSPAAVAKC